MPAASPGRSAEKKPAEEQPAEGHIADDGSHRGQRSMGRAQGPRLQLAGAVQDRLDLDGTADGLEETAALDQCASDEHPILRVIEPIEAETAARRTDELGCLRRPENVR